MFSGNLDICSSDLFISYVNEKIIQNALYYLFNNKPIPIISLKREQIVDKIKYLKMKNVFKSWGNANAKYEKDFGL